MTFRRIPSAIVLLVIVILVVVFGSRYLERSVWIGFTLVLSGILFYLSATSVEVKDGTIAKKILFVPTKTFAIDSIAQVEAVTVKRLGHVYITIGKSNPEDYSIFHLKDRSKAEIDSTCWNGRMSVGRYVAKAYGIKLTETERIKYTDGA